MFTANALHISQELLKVHDKLKSFAYRLRKEEKRVQSYNLSN
jgi:DNA anti-recombination protein RmuC